MGIVTTLYIGLLLLGQVHVHTVGDHVGSRSKNSKHYPPKVFIYTVLTAWFAVLSLSFPVNCSEPSAPNLQNLVSMYPPKRAHYCDQVSIVVALMLWKYSTD
ncbi:uncharacterized protein YALI1_F20323g [Yarrowia lipolytica]|uniref:Uncharacterized protein n=1 Tax=Yarrowia lipolytica TaxID=4952 RepID=A0A1D8NNJ8_YARLL|nr:hypothetical protein YALI1_F20323g [Yarrowia lipolytica]